MAALKKQWEREVIKVEFLPGLREFPELSAYLRTLERNFVGCIIKDAHGRVLKANYRVSNGEEITIEYPADEESP